MAERLISFKEKGNNETLRNVKEHYLTELVFGCITLSKEFIKNGRLFGNSDFGNTS